MKKNNGLVASFGLLAENGSGISKKYLEKNYLTMQEAYNTFASTYWEIIGAASGQSKKLLSLSVGDDLTNAVIDVSKYIVGLEIYASGTGNPSFNRIIKGTPAQSGDYLTLNLDVTYSSTSSTIKLKHLSSDGSLINEVLLLSVSFSGATPNYTLSAVSQKKESQILRIDDIDFGVITEISTSVDGAWRNFFSVADCLLGATIPTALVNLPYLYSKIGYAAQATIELGAAGDYTSGALWLRGGFVVWELKAVITNGTQVKGVSPDKLSFDADAKTATITIDEELAGWTAQIQVVYDVTEPN
jgi:hypothetical protein